jgi:response regulator of citrate/malate metabolism
VLSAARDMASVRRAMAAGALHFMIKPFSIDALRQRLSSYAEVHARRSVDRDTDQGEVDRLYDLLRRGGGAPVALPKGHSAATAELVLGVLAEAGGDLSAADVADRTGLSRPTAQRYLATFAETGAVRRTLRYGSAGRPEHRYALDSGA